MEPEPEPQESHQSYLNYNLEQQDILLDNIKEYRKIIRNIMDEYFGTIRRISRCRVVSFTK